MSITDEPQEEYSKDLIYFIVNRFGIKKIVEAVDIKEIVDTIGMNEIINVVGIKEVLNAINIKEVILNSDFTTISKMFEEIDIDDLKKKLMQELKDNKITEKDILKLGRLFSKLGAEILGIIE